MNRTTHCATAPLVSIALSLAACGADPTPRERAAANFSPQVVRITATDSGYIAPDTLDAGWVRFELHNRSTDNHMAQLVRFESGRTLEEYVGAYERIVSEGGRRPDWAKRVGGPGAAAPGDSSNALQYVVPGDYALVDLLDQRGDRIPNLTRGMAKPLIVHQSEDEAISGTAPAPDVEIRMVDYAFATTSELDRGRQLVRVVNAGEEPHEIIMVKLQPNKTASEAAAWFEAPDEPPPFLPGGSGGLGAIAADSEAYFEVQLTPGEYALLCLVSAPDGQPHIAHGMFAQVTVR